MWWGGEEPPAVAVEPPAVAVEPPAVAVEPPAAVEPKYQCLSQLPADIKAKFEVFVRSQWRKLKGQEIRSFHRLVERPGDFQDGWQKFQACQQPQEPATTARESLFVAESERMSPEKYKALLQFIKQNSSKKLPGRC